ncbi:MAG: rod shape-determining protein RodA [Alphaproteobacteria bacterium]
MSASSLETRSLSLLRKLMLISWPAVLVLALVAAVGAVMLYSAANGHIDPWASRQLVRFAVALVFLVAVAVIDPRLWFRHAYLVYGGALLLLVAVEVMGDIGLGAQRWLDIGVIRLQPSEIMKIALVLALARYFHGVESEDIGDLKRLLVPAVMILAPAALVLRQPDLGTAMILGAVGAVMFYLAGVRLWKFMVVGGAGLAMIPLAWQFLRDYQKARILTFLDPERDPLGAGYHILQSKIALGSGGTFGKGFLQGSQSHLNFLPEKQTDFIFTMLAEEWGLVGGLALLFLYILVIGWGVTVALRSRNQFGRLLSLGVVTTFFLYVFINIAMVMGLLPIVGVPLPLVSYGGTSMLTLMVGMGLVMGVAVHRDQPLTRYGPD